MLKFGIKVGLAAGAVYYLSEQGVWGQNDETQKVCHNICATIDPYVKQVKEKLPIQIPELPSSNKVSFVTKQYWNGGVMATFDYVKDLPQHVGEWMAKGKEAALNNQGIKQFVDSFSASEEKK